MAEVIQQRIEPLFFINGDVDQNEKFLTTLETCYAVRDVVGSESYIDGAQRIGGVWRIYMLDAVARAQVLATGISLRDTQVTIYDRNPFLTPHLRLGQEDLETTRLYVRNIPLSYDNEVITGYLKDMNVEMLGNLKYCRARTPEGKLTNFKTGDRFVEIVVPDEPLPKKKEMGVFTASLYYKQQKQTEEEKVCGNCNETGHIRRNCPNEVVCFECNQPGHKRGSPLCQGLDAVDTGTADNDGNQDDSGDDESEESDEGENGEKDEVKETENSGEDEVKERENSGEKETEEVDNEAKTKQMKLSALWSTMASAAPKNTPAGRTASPARVRKADDRSPAENENEKSKKKKSKSGKTNSK